MFGIVCLFVLGLFMLDWVKDNSDKTAAALISSLAIIFMAPLVIKIYMFAIGG